MIFHGYCWGNNKNHLETSHLMLKELNVGNCFPRHWCNPFETLRNWGVGWVYDFRFMEAMFQNALGFVAVHLTLSERRIFGTISFFRLLVNVPVTKNRNATHPMLTQ